MSLNRNIILNTANRSDFYVRSEMFGVNALADKNTTLDGNVLPNFENALETINAHHLRFPGGTMEVINDLMAESTATRLAPTLVNFMNWVKAENEAGNPISVTLGITAKRVISYQEVYDFARLAMTYYGDYIEAFEIGNEYSILPEVIDETLYGQRADVAARALEDAFRSRGLVGDDQPDILLQIADTFGRGSDYKGTGNHLDANRDIISQLSPTALAAVDGAIAHYYYTYDHADGEGFAPDWDVDGYFDETYHVHAKFNAWSQAWAEATDLPDLARHITEWNIEMNNVDQHGMKSAGTFLKQFEHMIEMDAQTGFIWPVQHKTGNALVGNHLGNSDAGPAGAMFGLMSRALGSDDSDPFYLLDLGDVATQNDLEIVAFQNSAKTVVYVASRAEQNLNVALDVRTIVPNVLGYSATVVGIDMSTSDGLSEMGDDQGMNRLAKRAITLEEYNEYKTLAFFDNSNRKHIDFQTDDTGAMVYLTYLPTFDDIIPMDANPTSIDDYYFASENDVAAALEYLSQSDLGDLSSIGLELAPYEVAELVFVSNAAPATAQSRGQTFGSSDLFAIDLDGYFIGIDGPVPTDEMNQVYYNDGNNTIRATATMDLIHALGGNDNVFGDLGDDVIKGGEGHDTIDGGQANDTIIGGAGDDILTGGDGADVFVFQSTAQSQRDIVTDFQVGVDKLVFLDVDACDHLGAVKDITLTDTADGAVFSYKNATILLENQDISGLDWADFLFL